MKSLIRQLFRDKSTAAMLLISSFIIGVCALAPSVFVIIVLNKFLASGVTATLLYLALGAVLLLGFEFAFRQNRSIMIQSFNKSIFQPLMDSLSKKIKEVEITGEQFKKLEKAGAIIKGATNPSITASLLDWPFVLMFLLVLLLINWTAAFITAIFMFLMIALHNQRVNLNMVTDTKANLEILLTGLLTITVMSVGALQIVAGTLDVGLLIGSNILAARALQGTNKYIKSRAVIQHREIATKEIYEFIKR